MADLEQFKQKYAPVLETLQSFSDEGAAVESVSLDGEKLYLKASVPSQVIANRVWDVIKKRESLACKSVFLQQNFGVEKNDDTLP